MREVEPTARSAWPYVHR